MSEHSWASALGGSTRLWAKTLGDGASILTAPTVQMVERAQNQLASEQQSHANGAAQSAEALEAQRAQSLLKWERIQQEQYVLALFSFVRERHRHFEAFAINAAQLAELCVQKVFGDDRLALTDSNQAKEQAKSMFLSDSLPVHVSVSRVDKSEFCRHVGMVLNISEAPELEPGQVAIRCNNQSLSFSEERAVDLWKQSEST